MARRSEQRRVGHLCGRPGLSTDWDGGGAAHAGCDGGGRAAVLGHGAGTGGPLASVTHWSDTTVAVLDTATNTVVATVPGRGSRHRQTPRPVWGAGEEIHRQKRATRNHRIAGRGAL